MGLWGVGLELGVEGLELELELELLELGLKCVLDLWEWVSALMSMLYRPPWAEEQAPIV